MKTLFLLLTSLLSASTTFSQANQSQNLQQESTVNVSSFQSQQKGTAVELSWTVVNEQNVNSYEIQKSSNGSSFNSIGTIAAQDNSNTFKYAFLDATPTEGENYYRLRSIDKKGDITFSDISHINTGFGRTGINVLSNPVQGGVLNLQLNNINNGKYIISLYSNSGQKVFARSLDFTAGSSTEIINLPQNIGRGTYFLQVTNGMIRMNKQVFLN